MSNNNKKKGTGKALKVQVDGKYYPSLFAAAIEIGCNYSWLWCKLQCGETKIYGKTIKLVTKEEKNMATTITITNGKGGTGKTSLCVFLAEYLYSKGFKTLVIDLDPNCSISEVYGFVLKEHNSKAFMQGIPTTPYTAKTHENATLDIIPSDLNLGMLANISDTKIKIQLKKQNLLQKYDFVLIDPPGTWNSQTRNAIYAADSIVVCGKCSPLDFEATKNYVVLLSECGLDDNTEFCVVCNAYNAQKDPDKILEKYRDTFKNYLLDNPIPELTSLKRLAYDPAYKIRADIIEKLTQFVQAATKGQVQ